MERISILGLGLMGGSLGLALKAKGFGGTVAGYARRSETRNQALEMGVCDEAYDDAADAVRGAELSVLCVPICSMSSLITACKDSFAEGSILTDVGSTKCAVTAEAHRILKGRPVAFVGSHPIAGSEQEGLDAATAELYDGAVVVVTYGESASDEQVASVVSFWESLGANVVLITVDEHDLLTARTSHLPHVVAALLAGAVGRPGTGLDVGRMCGTGFIDTTRIVQGSPQVWRDIVQTNASFLATELAAFGEELETFRSLLENNDFVGIEELFRRSREAREALLASRERALGEAETAEE